MKKRIGLVLLLIAVTAVMAFAENGRRIDFNYSTFNTKGNMLSGKGKDGPYITGVIETTTGIRIYYACPNSLANGGYGTVTFDVTAYYEDGSEKKNKDREFIVFGSKGTIDQMFLRSSRITSVFVDISN